MAERERFRYDSRSFAYAARRAVVAGAVTFSALWGTSRSVGPALRDLPGGLSAPGVGPVAILATVVGLALGWVRMRSTRRIVAVGLSESDLARPGSRALAIARHNGAGGSPGRVAGTVPVQRWTPDLLVGGTSVQGSESLTS